MQTCLNVITQHALIERAKRRIQIISSAFQNECKNAASRHEIADGTNAGCCFLTCSDMACFALDALTISLPFEYFVEICNLSWYLMSSSVNAIYGPVRWTFSSLRLCYSFPCISKAERVRNCIVMWNHMFDCLKDQQNQPACILVCHQSSALSYVNNQIKQWNLPHSQRFHRI